MSRFYIKQISASGPTVDFSSIIFTDGVNIVCGPSNTGKTYMIKCINFMFGGALPFTKAETGYDKVIMRMESDDGQSIQMERMIVEKNGEESGATKVQVVSDIVGIESGEYSTTDNSYSDMLFKMIGLDSHRTIISNKNFDTNSLTMRSIFHLFYLDEENIISASTPLDVPKYNKINGSLMGLLFLLTGNDYHEIISELTKDEVERRATQKSGVLNYLNKKIAELTEKRGELEQQLAADYDIDIEGKLDATLSQIEDVESEIADASAKSRQILEQVYEYSAKLEEARFLENRYASLQSQYSSDLKRLEFIIDGENKSEDQAPLMKCPFCDGEVKNHPVRISYISAAKAEVQKIRMQQRDLQEAIADVKSDMQHYENEMRRLNHENETIVQHISDHLRPKAAKLREQLESYKRLVAARREIYALDAMATEFNTDAFQKEHEEDEKAQTFSAKEFFDKDLWKIFSDRFEVYVKECAYPNCTAARMSIETADAIVNGKRKKYEGKGYRAYLNTVVLFSLMKVLEENAVYTLRLLIVDSPILSLKEKKMELDESEKATPSMRESLFRCILANCGANQVIIAENEIPDNVDYSTANLIEFTMDDNEGRYGFLKTRKVLKDTQ